MMYAFQGETYKSAMAVPVPVRKWLIKRWNKQKEQEQKAQNQKSGTVGSDMTKPLSPAERMKMIRRNQQDTNRSEAKPAPPSIMEGMRNRS